MPDVPAAPDVLPVLVAFHAHPDDEALLTGGTLARAAAEGHRVVLVVATDGDAGLAADAPGQALGRRRVAELERSAQALGVARVVRLGHRDSGWLEPTGPGPDGEPPFSDLPVDLVAGELAAVLVEESAAVLLVYDPAGGYGHPDHVHVHVTGVRAAELAGTPVVLEATVDRTLVRRALRVVHVLPGFVSDLTADRLAQAFSARESITHRVDVRAYVRVKQDALRAHTSQTETRGEKWWRPWAGLRGVGLLAALPGPVARLVLGREWFVERGRQPGATVDDVFDTVRRSPASR